ncbi:MAG: amidohydrolase family protein [Proteobacteria bacterium]|nr:amidohydrolase family protein [Pseudomonadota bacterium]MCP4915395.1 amidohydrolase family protein [Pseudomonadota bacterium]
MRHCFAHALLPEGLRRNVAVTLDGATITAVERCSPDEAQDGLALPGLINSHTHLELSVPLALGSHGLPDWVADLGMRSDDGAIQDAANAAYALGTAALADVSNTLATARFLSDSPLQGVLHSEVLGIDQSELPHRELPAVDGFHVRTSPHAPYSTSPQLITQALGQPGPTATIHLDEDPDERRFLADGTGPWADFIRLIGRDLSAFEPPGCSPTAYLARLGVLDKTALVHMVHASAEDLALVKKAGSTIVLCPRSNQHIGGQLPDVPAMLAADLPLALGTDALASSPDLDVLGEVRVLMNAFPKVHPEVWLRAATTFGARLLGLPHLGEFAVGKRPGIVLLEGCAMDLAVRQPARRWVVEPGGAT